VSDATGLRRFRIKFDARTGWLLALVGITPARSSVAIEPMEIDVRFGWAHFRVRRELIQSAGPAEASWRYGVGIHTNVVDWLCVNGSTSNLVELRLAPPQRIWMIVPVRCKRFIVSLEEPEAFLRELGFPLDVAPRSPGPSLGAS
jgi:hypothetical protein